MTRRENSNLIALFLSLHYSNWRNQRASSFLSTAFLNCWVLLRASRRRFRKSVGIHAEAGRTEWVSQEMYLQTMVNDVLPDSSWFHCLDHLSVMRVCRSMALWTEWWTNIVHDIENLSWGFGIEVDIYRFQCREIIACLYKEDFEDWDYITTQFLCVVLSMIAGKLSRSRTL